MYKYAFILVPIIKATWCLTQMRHDWLPLSANVLSSHCVRHFLKTPVTHCPKLSYFYTCLISSLDGMDLDIIIPSEASQTEKNKLIALIYKI